MSGSKITSYMVVYQLTNNIIVSLLILVVILFLHINSVITLCVCMELIHYTLYTCIVYLTTSCLQLKQAVNGRK